MSEDVESLKIAVQQIARDNQELKSRVAVLERALRSHVNSIGSDAHSI